MILSIDVETTGLDPLEDKVCEIAGVEIYDLADPTQDKTWSSYVNPGRPIPALASSIHHIVDGDVQLARPIEAIEIPEADYYLAHNARFEESMLNIGPWLCTYKCAVGLYPQMMQFDLQYVRYELGLVDIDHINRDEAFHRALPDACVCASIFRRMLEDADLDQLVEMSNRPVILPRFSFGKHAYQPLEEVPTGYLRWILDNGDFDEDIIYTAQYWVDRKAA